MIMQSEPLARMKHFAAAFFGYHLQGRNEYANYFSEEFINQFDDLAWGVYPVSEWLNLLSGLFTHKTLIINNPFPDYSSKICGLRIYGFLDGSAVF